MKKIVSLVIALVLALSCTAALAELTFTTGGTSGTYYAFGNVLAQYITNNSDVQVTAVSGNGSADNIDKLDLEDAQLGFVQNDVANYAYNGIRFCLMQKKQQIDLIGPKMQLLTFRLAIFCCLFRGPEGQERVHRLRRLGRVLQRHGLPGRL